MREYYGFATVAVLTLAGFMACEGQYNKTVVKKVDEALGPTYRRYQAMSYPTNNFGVATAYTASGGGSKIRPENFICDTWECLGKASSVPTDAQKLLDIDAFAAVGGGGPGITLSETEKKGLALNILLPKIYQIVQIGAGLDKDRTTVTNLQIGKAYPRLLRKTRMLPYLQSLRPDHPMKQAFEAGQLVLVVGDVVVDSMKVTVNVDQTAKANLDAKLDGIASKVFSGADLGVKVKKEVTGNYTFEVTRPVIMKTLGKRQTSGSASGPSLVDNWDDWETVIVPIKKTD